MKLANWLDENFPEFENVEISYGDHDSVPLPYIARLLVAALLNKNGSDCVFVIPQAEVMACLTALFSALTNTKHNFLKWRDDFAKNGLKTGQRVRLLPNNTIYGYSANYLEAEGKKFLRLNLLGANENNGSTSLPLEEILRLFPTSRTRPKGRAGTKAETSLSDLDKVVDIQSYGNYSLFKNRIILHGSKGKMDSFLEMWGIHRRNESGNIEASLNDLRDFPWGSISREGVLQSFNKYQICGEPVIVFSSRLSPIDEYCLNQEKNSRTVITSNKKAVLENTYEAQNLCQQHKFFLLTEEIDAAEAKELKELGFSIWQFSREEIFTGINNESDLEEAKKLIPLRMMYGAAGGDKNMVNIYQSESPLLETIERNIVEAGKSIYDSDINDQTVQPLKRIYWRSLELLETPEKKYQDWLLDQALAVEAILENQASFIGSENIEKLKTIMTDIMDDLLPGIKTHSQNKFETIRNIIESCSGKKVLVLCRHAEALEALKMRLGCHQNVTFLTYDEISVAKSIYDVAIMAGWPGKHLFSKLFNSGITDKIESVLYQNEIAILNSYFKQKEKAEEAVRLAPEQKAEIIGCAPILFNKEEGKHTPESVSLGDKEAEFGHIESKEKIAIFNVDWSKRPCLPLVSSQQQSRAVEAFYVSFNNDRCIYLSQTHKLPVIDPRTHQYRKKAAAELTGGDIVVFRQGGDREILKEIAEKLYPENYGSFVAQASEWKCWLNKLGNDASEIWLKLSEHGLQRNIMTITNWMKNEDLIGPQNLNDILMIAEATGQVEYIEKSTQIATAVRELRGIHVEAGFKLTKLLMTRLSQELHEDIQDHEKIASSLADVELMTVEEIDREPVLIMPNLTNEPHSIWWFDTLSSMDIYELSQEVQK